MKKILLLALIAVVPFIAWSQASERGERRFDPVKFQKMVEESLTKAAVLTPEEAKAFFPIYNEMRQKQRQMGRQIHELKKTPGNDEQSYAQTIAKINQLKVDMAKLEQDYYKRFTKAVPAEKVFKVMKAEDDFHRRMVQGQRGRGQERKGRPRPPRGERPQ